MIKAVLFDVDGVLVDSFDANLKFYQDLLIKLGYRPLTKKEFIPLMHYTLENVIKEYTHAPHEEVQKMLLKGKKFIEELYPYDLLKPVVYLTETIQKLHKTYQLGIVTSRVKEHIYSIPSLSTLEKYFQVTVGFEDTTNHKPHSDPLIFGCKKLGLKPDEVVYIGDAESDFLASKSANMHFILFGPTNFINASNHTDSFNNLPDIVSTLRSHFIFGSVVEIL